VEEVKGLEDLKIKLAVFWLFIAGAMSANTILYFLVPGVLDEIRAGTIVGMQASTELILGMAVAYFWTPLVMAVRDFSLVGLNFTHKKYWLTNLV
jgi:hypothetical protein